MPISRKDHAQFYFYMSRHTQATPAQCERLLRYAATLHRLDVERCNRPETDADRRKVESIQGHVRGLCVGINGIGCKRLPHFTYEPMAPPFVIVVPDGFSNYHGDVRGIVCPA